ncbi:hypothetical protein DHEL01_v212791 [Diaporthe helianthi]|uniref:Uncharacterized protein n=1 Tax=Diaporthe helianthi TaxID=158607 RepID=A0A2P5HEZ2_DIAHE|nr:hypothetical protein DHEL01_v212791 [Diaporthe helianthi]
MVMPAERKQNRYAMSNMTLANLALFSRATPTRPWGAPGDQLASWNFEHITDQGCTIEFRRSPGCGNVAKAKHWVNFTLGFVYHAAKGGVVVSIGVSTRMRRSTVHPSVVDLSAFVTRGCSALGPIAEDKSAAMVFNAAETARKKAEKARRASPDHTQNR